MYYISFWSAAMEHQAPASSLSNTGKAMDLHFHNATNRTIANDEVPANTSPDHDRPVGLHHTSSAPPHLLRPSRRRNKDAAMKMAKLNRARKERQITVLTIRKETSHGHRRVFRPSHHFDTFLVMSSTFVHSSTVQRHWRSRIVS